MELLVLGPVEVRRDGRVVAPAGRLQRLLLAMLLARANQPVTVDTLTDALWGDAPDPRAAQRLHLHVHRLRGLLGEHERDRVTFTAAAYQLRVAPGELDAERFESLVEQAERDVERDPRQAAELLRRALDLWRGTPLPEVDAPALQDWARRLTERRLAAQELLFQAELACGREAVIVADLAELVAEHPLRERLHALLMTALYRAGRQADALAAYRSARATLVAELGTEPGPELRELERRVLAGEPMPPPTPVPATQHAQPAQLPADVWGFVGRDEELTALDELLHRPGGGTGGGPDGGAGGGPSEGPGAAVAVVVAGTAGVGKTALAVRWAHRVRARFPDGQLYVDLRGYGPDQPVTPEDALAGFLRALGLEGAAIPRDLAERAARFRTLMDRRRMLILLDNARSIEQVRPLLPGGAGCATVVTSRDSLAGLVARDCARRIPLGRLSRAEARALLAELLGGERIAAATAGAAADPAPADAVANAAVTAAHAHADADAVDALITRCARLPLALRIAAELIREQPARGIADLASELADRQQALDALDLFDPDGDPHSAVRAVFSWSYQRLAPEAAGVFRLLGVHPGHDTDDHAVAALAGAGLRATRRALTVLVRAHLVDHSTTGRYQPHDLLRAYAAELAAEVDGAEACEAALARLRDHYLATALAAMDVVAPFEADIRPKPPAVPGEQPPMASYDAAWSWLDAERDNLLESVRHGSPPTYVTAMEQTLWRYLDLGGYHNEGITLDLGAARAARESGDVLAEAHANRSVGVSLGRLGLDHAAAIEYLRRALATYRQVGDRRMQAAALNNIAILHDRRGELLEAARLLEQARDVSGPDGDVRMRCAISINYTLNLRERSRFAEAERLLQEALPLMEGQGDQANVGNVLVGLAELRQFQGRHDDTALSYAERGLTIARETGYRPIEAHALRALGLILHGRGDRERALRVLDQALTLAHAVGAPELIVRALLALGSAHADAGDPAEALRHNAQALALATEGRIRNESARAEQRVGDNHAALGSPERARRHWRRALAYYEAMDLPQAADLRTRLHSLDGPHDDTP